MIRRLLAAVPVLVAVAVAAWPVTVLARQTHGGDVAADEALHEAAVGTVSGGGFPDVALVQRAWTRAGIDSSVFVSALSGVTGQGQAAESVSARLCGSAQIGWRVQSADQPVRGDLVRYLPASGGGDRLGIVVDQGHVVVVDTWDPERAGGMLITRVRRDAVLVEDWNHRPVDPIIARDSVALVCHVNRALLHGAAAVETTPAPGRVAIVDGALAIEDVRWAAGHPVMERHPLGVVLVVTLGGLALLLGGAGWALSRLVDLLQASTGALDSVVGHLGWLSLADPALLLLDGGAHALGALAAVLTAPFDGSAVHRALTTVVLTDMGAVLAPILLAAGILAALGRLTGWWSGERLLGMTLAVGWNVAGFLVTTLTGIDNGQTRVFEVVMAVVSDLVLIARPLVVVRAATGGAWALRIEGLFARAASIPALLGGHRGLEASQKGGALLADLVTLRPAALMDGGTRLREVGTGGRLALDAFRGGPGLVAELAPVVTTPGVVRIGSGGVLDVVSWFVYRPTAVVSDIVSECGRLATFLNRGLRSVDADSHLILRSADHMLSHLTPQQRHQILEVVLPHLRAPAEMASRHAGAQVIANLGSGQLPRPVVDMWPSPSPVPAAGDPLWLPPELTPTPSPRW